MPLFLGIDTGGTYTDAVLLDPKRGVLASAKALTTKHDLAIGIGEAMEAVLPVERGEIALVSLSTTLATNAIVEGQGSPVCLMLLGYDPGSLDRIGLRQALPDDPILYLRGGHGPTGDEQSPLDLDGVRAAVRRHAGDVAAFAVSGFFSVRNPAHEIAARQVIQGLCDRPVTCGHELTSRLDAPRRALTAALNARLIPQLTRLIHAVQRLIRDQGLSSPLMVVKGDGSLLDAAQAMSRPVETILSGPAASVVGASYLSGRRDVIVADMGGTTTDIALLDDGRPVLRADGANVGGWRTMVEAVAVDTYGLGGDSEVSQASNGLTLGPRRVVPLSLLAHEHAGTLDRLRAQTERPLSARDGRFVLRQRPLDTARESLPEAQRRLWDALGPGPRALSDLPSGYVDARALERMVSRGSVALAGFTPTDACHVLGRQTVWSSEAARLGARLYRRAMSGVEPDEDGIVRFCEDVVEQVIVQAGHALVTTALHRVGEDPGDAADSPAQRLIDRALRRDKVPSLLGVVVELRRPIVAIGAPAATYFPEIARRVRAELVVPDQAAVANAVGAVAGGVVQTVRAIITSPSSGLFRAHLRSGVRDFADLEAAATHAAAEVERLARQLATEAGARDIQLSAHRRDRVVRDAGGGEIFIESAIEAVASGRPRLAGETEEEGSSS